MFYCAGATIIARWMCPWSEISLQDINNKLENIANMVRPKLGLEKDQKIPSKSGLCIDLFQKWQFLHRNLILYLILVSQYLFR